MNEDKYTFHYGDYIQLLSTEPFPNRNMLYATAQLLFLTKNRLDFPDYMNGIHACEKEVGVYYRSPTDHGDTSVDDYIALTCFSDIACDVYDKASHRWGYVTVNWPVKDFKQWLYRFQGLWVHMKISCGMFVGPIGRLAWSISIVLAARKPMQDADSWIQSHLMILVKERRGWRSWTADRAIAFWRKKKVMTTSEIMAQYTGVPDHPLVEVWKGYK